MKNILPLILSLVLFDLVAQDLEGDSALILQDSVAQDLEGDSTKCFTMGTKFTMGLGVRMIENLSEMNNALQYFSYPEIKNTVTTMDLSFTFFKHRTLVTFSYRFLAFPKSSGQELSLTGFGVGNELRVGHNFSKSESWSIYPLVGLATQISSFSFTYNEEASLVDAIGSIPAEPRRIKGSEVMASIGGGFERTVNKISNQKFGFTVGFQTGYYFNLANTWYSGIRKANTNTSTGGFEARLTFSSIRFPRLK